MLSTTLNKLSLWFSHHSAFSGYFEPVIQRVKPAWRQGLYRDQVLNATKAIGDFVHITLQPQHQWKAHKAGQYIELTVELNGRLLTRIFTIASSPQQYVKDKTITLVIKTNELGRFTPQLADELTINSWVNISAAQETDLLLLDSRGLVMHILLYMHCLVKSGNSHFLSFY
jgi:stearoyl-CoA 9-desaturase NADPH oxidoreductase